MRKPNTKKLILPIAFMGFLFLVSAATILCKKDSYSPIEKRYLEKFPKLSLHTVINGEFQDEFEKYLDDHIFAREFFVGLNSYFDLAMCRNATLDIYNSKEGYLINAPKDFDQKVFEKNLKQFGNFSSNIDIPSSVMIVPTPGYVLNDKLPLFHEQYIDDELFVKASKLTPEVAFIDTRIVLREAAIYGQDVFYRTDHHLTSRGSYILYSLFCSVNGLACPSENRYSIESVGGFDGTTKSGSGFWLTPSDCVEMWNIGDEVRVSVYDSKDECKTYDSLFLKEKLKDEDKYPVFLGGNSSLTKIENPAADEGSILIIKDSYAHCFAGFISHNYKEVYMLDLRYYRGCVSEFAKENKIDEILYLYGLDTLLTDTNSAWLF